MENTTLTFGKYNGLTYKQVLDKDYNYCKYIFLSPPNERIQDFKNFLELRFKDKQREVIEDKIEKLKFQLSKLN